MLFISGLMFGLAIGHIGIVIGARNVKWHHVFIMLALGVMALYSA